MLVQDKLGQFVVKGDIITIDNPKASRKVWSIYVGKRVVVLVTPTGVRENTLDVLGGEILKENVLDQVKEPRRAHEIVERARSKLGQMAPQSQGDDGGHGFVLWCRYGNEPTTAPKPHVHVPPVDVDCNGNVLQPADAVRFDCGPFSHWAVYVGNGDVVHMTANGVVKQPLLQVAGEDPFVKDNSMDEIQSPFMTQGILDMTRTRLGDKSFNFLNNNCEIFVNQVRCGNAKSRQVEKYMEENNVGSYEFSQDGPHGVTHTVHVVSPGGHHSSSRSMSSASSSSSGPGHVFTSVMGDGAATATSSGPGGVITSVAPPGGFVASHRMPAPPAGMEHDLYCYGCHAGRSSGNL